MASSSVDGAVKSARESMEKSRLDVMECEEEIKSIKDALKSLAMGSAGSESSSSNQLEVTIQKAKKATGTADDQEGVGEGEDTTTYKIHLSSPIEERTITKVFDPLDPTAEGSVAKFESIETSNALLTVEVFSKEGGDDESSTKLGESAAHDLLPLCEDMEELLKKGGEKTSLTLEVAIVAEKGMDDVSEKVAEKETVEETAVAEEAATEGDKEEEDMKADESESWEDAEAEEANEGEETTEETTKETSEDKEEDTPESDKKEEEADETPAKDETEEAVAQDESKAPELQLPIYTLTVKLEYKPSADDRRDALYIQLNEVSKRKVAAIESLRKNAVIVNRAKSPEAPSPTKDNSKGGKPPAVKAGFLNKPKAEKPPPFWKRWYEKTIGPKSMLWVVGPIAKNYVIFAGVSLFIHWKGDLLALPPPV